MKFNNGCHPASTNVDFLNLFFPIAKLYWQNIYCLPNVYLSFTPPPPEMLTFIMACWMSHISVMPSARNSGLNTTLPPPAATFRDEVSHSFVLFHYSWPQPWVHPWLITVFRPPNPKCCHFFHQNTPSCCTFCVWFPLWSWASLCHLEFHLPPS